MSDAPKPLAEFKVGVEGAIFSVDSHQHRLLVLLVQRQQDPYQGRWSLPGTLVRAGESLEAAARRVLAAKVSWQNLFYLEQLYTFGDPGRDPREATGRCSIRYLSVSYFALGRYEETQLLEESHAAWYPIQAIPDLAFDHQEILKYGSQRLRNKLEYSPIAFKVLPEFFTLNDLYQFYTTVLGDSFSDYSNFRARVLKLGILSDTGIKVSRGAGRPAGLYRFDAEAFALLQDKPMIFI